MVSKAEKSYGAVENCANSVPDKHLPEGAGQIDPLRRSENSNIAPHRCNCGILGYLARGIPDRQCSRRATVGEFCAQHAKMEKTDEGVFRWD